MTTAMSIKRMDVDALLALQVQVGKQLAEKRVEIERAIKLIGNGNGHSYDRRTNSHLKGTKVAPKYRGPDGDTWAGRGAKPRWMVALLKSGHKINEFAIGASVASTKKVARKRSAKQK